MVDFTALAGSLDLYELMVNYVAGGILLSLIIWAVILLVTGILGRLSLQSVLIVVFTFLGVALIGYFGSIGAFLITIGALWFMIQGILNYIDSRR